MWVGKSWEASTGVAGEEQEGLGQKAAKTGQRVDFPWIFAAGCKFTLSMFLEEAANKAESRILLQVDI